MLSEMTSHAAAREQQRLDPAIVKILLDFGKVDIQRGRNSAFYSLGGRKERNELSRILRSALALVESQKNVFAIESAGQVITCGIAYKRRLKGLSRRRASRKGLRSDTKK